MDHRHRMPRFRPKMRGLNTSNRSFTARMKTCRKPRDCCRCTVEHCNVFCAGTGSSKMQHNHDDVPPQQSASEKKNDADQACQNGPTIYFDGSCALCSAEIAHYASRVGGDKLGFVDVSNNDSRLGDDLTSPKAMRRFHVRRSDGSLVSGARAGVLPVLEVGYRAFLPIRPVISKVVGWFSRAPAASQK
jgi:predicted DCC family thiol-disulfide oxidoreductase YuxK